MAGLARSFRRERRTDFRVMIGEIRSNLIRLALAAHFPVFPWRSPALHNPAKVVGSPQSPAQSRAARIARIDALATLLDTAFIVPEQHPYRLSAP